MKRALVLCFLFICIPCMVLAGRGVPKRFEARAKGVVKDTWTGLEWVTAPDKPITFQEAKTWAENLTVDGGGWRMPTIKELKTLYMKDVGTRNMTPLLKTAGWWVWSGEEKQWTAWLFGFRRGNEGASQKFWKHWAFAVRNQK